MVITPQQNFPRPPSIQQNTKQLPRLNVSLYAQYKGRFQQWAKHEISKITPQNVIYYFAGGTTLIIFLIFVIPIIFQGLIGFFTPKEQLKIATPTTQIKTSTIPLVEQRKPIELYKIDEEKLNVTTKDETIKIFQESLNTKNSNLLQGYITNKPTITISLTECCGESTSVYGKSIINGLLEGVESWNFDQNNQLIGKIIAKDGRYKDNFAVISNKNTFIGIVLDKENHISSINVMYDIQGFFDSFEPANEELVDE